MTTYRIETIGVNGWTDNIGTMVLLCVNQPVNCWPSRDAALAACDELSTVLDPIRLRVVAVDA